VKDTRFTGSLFVFLLALLPCVFSACSSAPKQPAQTSLARDAAAVQLEQANREADRGNYALALSLASEARRLAISVDDPALRIRTGLSMGNSLFFLGRRDEADEVWRAAWEEAEAGGDAEMAAISRIYRARRDLLSLIIPANSLSRGLMPDETIADIRLRVQAEIGAVKTDPLSAALGWIVIGLAEKELGRYREAEDALRKALAIHDKERYLEQAAYDWYLIASVFSVAGQYDDALAALQEALSFDRRAENGYALGQDWLAIGDVYVKAGKRDQSAPAYHRAAEIFRAGGFTAEAEYAEDLYRSGHSGQGS
jgi:tetratricopeptide (TPR) repeat protein